MQKIGPDIAREVRKKMAKEGITGTKDELNAIYAKRFNETVSIRQLHGLAGVADPVSGPS